jgi:hypothetical protein
MIEMSDKYDSGIAQFQLNGSIKFAVAFTRNKGRIPRDVSFMTRQLGIELPMSRPIKVVTLALSTFSPLIRIVESMPSIG